MYEKSYNRFVTLTEVFTMFGTDVAIFLRQQNGVFLHASNVQQDLGVIAAALQIPKPH